MARPAVLTTDGPDFTATPTMARPTALTTSGPDLVAAAAMARPGATTAAADPMVAAAAALTGPDLAAPLAVLPHPQTHSHSPIQFLPPSYLIYPEIIHTLSFNSPLWFLSRAHKGEHGFKQIRITRLFSHGQFTLIFVRCHYVRLGISNKNLNKPPPTSASKVRGNSPNYQQKIHGKLKTVISYSKRIKDNRTKTRSL